MTNWVRVDTKFTSHPKVLDIGPLGECLWLRGLCYAGEQLTDGFIPTTFVRRMGDMKGLVIAAKLVAAGLWSDADGGYVIHDYLDWQQSRDQVATISSKRAEAGRRGGKQKASNLLDNGLAKGKQTGSKTLADTDTDTDTDTDVSPNGDRRSDGGRPTKRQPTTSAPYLLFEAMLDESGSDPDAVPKRERDRQLGVAKRLAEDGMTPDEVRSMVGWLRAQSWVNGIDLFLLEKQRTRWLTRPKPNGQGPPGPDTRFPLPPGVTWDHIAEWRVRRQRGSSLPDDRLRLLDEIDRHNATTQPGGAGGSDAAAQPRGRAGPPGVAAD